LQFDAKNCTRRFGIKFSFFGLPKSQIRLKYNLWQGVAKYQNIIFENVFGSLNPSLAAKML